MSVEAPRRLRSEEVHDRLLADVLEGRLAPGDPLPGERALSEAFGVNRHAVREALKRLQQAGVVQVSHGGATRVTDWRRTAGLDLLTSLAGADGVIGAVAEMRAAVGADVARLCALRAPDARPRPSDSEDGYIAFWETVTDGAGNVAYRLALNTLVAAQRSGAIDAERYRAEREDLAAQRELAGAIATGDADGAQRLALDLLRRASSEAAGLIDDERSEAE